MSPEQKALVKETWRKVAPMADAAARLFYDRLFEIPSLKGLFFDLIADASFHTDGDSPLEVVNPTGAPLPGDLRYDTLTQHPSYDVKAFLRYNPSTFLCAAVGI